MAPHRGEGDRFVFAVVRGDTALNEQKLKAVLNADALGPATEDEIRQAGAEPGYGSPVGLTGVLVVADSLAAHSPNLVAGANRAVTTRSTSITAAITRPPSWRTSRWPRKAALARRAATRWHWNLRVALMELWQAGDRLAQTLDATYLDGAGRAHRWRWAGIASTWIGCWLRSPKRTTMSTVSCRPAPIAPYEVHLMTLGKATPR